MTDAIKIDVWSDIACPWCYIGKRNLEKGLAAASADADAPVVEVEYHSYELSPDTPVDFDGSEAEFLSGHRGLEAAQVQEMIERVTTVAADAGLTYRYDILQHTNTVRAHELLHAAKTAGRQHEMAERLLAAYFTEGRHLGRIDELVQLAGEIGLDEASVRADLESERYRADVRADQDQARAYGISGVPFFVIDGTYGVSGAQPAEAFTQIARQLWEERRGARDGGQGGSGADEPAA